MTDWARESCRPLAPGTPSLGDADIAAALVALPGWTHEGNALVRTVAFRNFHQTMAFANAVAWIAHQQDHHPEMTLGYKTCRVAYTTHSVGGISANDLICAARINDLVP